MTDDLSVALERRFGEPFVEPGLSPGDGELARMAARRSHRAFSEEPVPAPVLRAVLGCALSAPSKSDLQQACVVHVTDRHLRERLGDLAPSMPWVRTAPEFFVFCGDNRRIRRICELRGRPFANDHLDSFFNAAVDAGILLGTFVQAAEAAGLGCCPVSVLRNRADAVAELLDLPQHVFPVAGMALGHPAGEGQVSPRLPLPVTVHENRYDDADLAALVESYDRRRALLQPIAPADQRHRDRFGESPAYGWSEDKARQVSSTERAQFGTFVRGQGFDLR